MKLGFFSLHPVSTFLFFLCEFLVVLLFNHPIILVLSFSVSLMLKFSVSGKKAVKLLSFCFVLILFFSLFNCLFSHYGVTVLYVFKSGNNLTLESIVYGAVSGLKVAIMLLWLDYFNEIITPEKFIYLFGRISPKIALIISMSLRFIPLFQSQLKEIEESRKGIGLDSKSGNIIKRIKYSVSNISILITWVLERGIDTSYSMTSKGYGSGKRSSYSPYKFSAVDIILLLFCVLISVSSFFVKAGFECIYNPLIVIGELNICSIAFLVFFVLISIFPLLFTFVEKKRWQL